MPFLAPAAAAAGPTGMALEGSAAAATAGAAAGSGWTTAAIATTAVASGVTAYGSYQQGKSQKAMARYNADVAEQEARQAEQAGRYASKEIREQKRRILSSQNTAYAKSGVQMEGTPLLVGIQTAADEEYNAMMTSYNAGIQSSRFSSEAKLSRMQGKSAGRAGLYGAGGSLFSGAADMARIKLMQRYGS